MADAWMPGARCIRAETDGGQLGGGAPRVVWLTLGADPRVVSVCSAAQRLNQENRPCHLVWDPLTGDIAQLLPIVRAGCALGTPENIDYAPDLLPHRQPGVNREGRLCVQIGVLGSPREPFTSYQMIGLSEILAWLDSWQIPRRWPAGRRPRSGRRPGRAAGRCGRSAGTSAPPRYPTARASAPAASTSTRSPARRPSRRELAEPALPGPAPIRLGSRAPHEILPARTAQRRGRLSLASSLGPGAGPARLGAWRS